MKVEVLVRHSKQFLPPLGTLTFGRYTLEAIPTSQADSEAAEWRSILRFEDKIRDGETASQPFEEAKLIAGLLSATFRMRVHLDAGSLNGVTGILPAGFRQTYQQFESQIQATGELAVNLNNINSLDLDLARQVARSFETYRTAQNLLHSNLTLSYFLFVIAVECLSTKTMPTDPKKPGSQTCDKFVGFVLKYISAELKNKWPGPGEKDWDETLRTVYHVYRSGFTHGGKDIPDAVYLTDRLNRDFIKNIIDNKEIRTPGIKWFERVVHNCLVGFLTTCKGQEQNDQLKALSLEKGMVSLKAKQAIKGSTAVFENQFDLD